MSETLGKETIAIYNTSETKSNQKSIDINYQKANKELMSQDEITVMDGGKCIYHKGQDPSYLISLSLQSISITSYWKIILRKV